MLKNKQTLIKRSACKQRFLCVFPLYIRASGSCVKAVYRRPAGQQLYREVEGRQARFKYLRGSNGAELSNPRIWEDPSKASLSHCSLHHFTLLLCCLSAAASPSSLPLLSLIPPHQLSHLFLSRLICSILDSIHDPLSSLDLLPKLVFTCHALRAVIHFSTLWDWPQSTVKDHESKHFRPSN